MKTNLKHRFTAIAALCLASLFAGNTCGGNLDPEGVYKGDMIEFRLEDATLRGYAFVHAFVTWEKENREVLRQWPAVKEVADDMRAHAEEWFATINTAHDEYVAAKEALKRAVDEAAQEAAANDLDEKQAKANAALKVTNEVIDVALNLYLKYFAKTPQATHIPNL